MILFSFVCIFALFGSSLAHTHHFTKHLESGIIVKYHGKLSCPQNFCALIYFKQWDSVTPLEHLSFSMHCSMEKEIEFNVHVLIPIKNVSLNGNRFIDLTHNCTEGGSIVRTIEFLADIDEEKEYQTSAFHYQLWNQGFKSKSPDSRFLNMTDNGINNSESNSKVQIGTKITDINEIMDFLKGNDREQLQ